jgi:hypothetical protein
MKAIAWGVLVFVHLNILSQVQGLLNFVPQLEDVERARICNKITSIVLNAEGMTQGDVMILDDQFFDGNLVPAQIDHETMEITRMSRVVFDHDRGQFLFLSRTQFNHFAVKEVSEQSDGRSIKTLDAGVWIDLKAKQFLQKTKKGVARFPLAKETFDEEALSFFSDPRSLGMFSEGFGPYERGKRMYDELATGDSLIKSRITGDYCELQFQVAYDEPNKVSQVFLVRLDHETNLPIKSSTFMRLDSGETTQPHETWYDWEPKSNLHVPNHIKCSAVNEFVDPKTLKKKFGQMSSESFYHWFSLNEPLAASLLDSNHLKSQSDFEKMLDPRANNAEKIVERLELKLGKTEPNDNFKKKANSP